MNLLEKKCGCMSRSEAKGLRFQNRNIDSNNPLPIEIICPCLSCRSLLIIIFFFFKLQFWCFCFTALQNRKNFLKVANNQFSHIWLWILGQHCSTSGQSLRKQELRYQIRTKAHSNVPGTKHCQVNIRSRTYHTDRVCTPNA